jgi:hypothetical protein
VRFKIYNTNTDIVEFDSTASSSNALVAIGSPEAAASTVVYRVRRATIQTETALDCMVTTAFHYTISPIMSPP